MTTLLSRLYRPIHQLIQRIPHLQSRSLHKKTQPGSSSNLWFPQAILLLQITNCTILYRQTQRELERLDQQRKEIEEMFRPEREETESTDR